MAVGRYVASLALAGVAAVSLFVATPAAAQSIFEQIFGGLRRVFSPPAASVYSDPMQSMASAPDARVLPPPDNGPARAFCVRTCDGHYFPVEAHGRLTAAAACQTACPAAETRLYSGSNIDYALARDGSRYADLANAFLYRKKLIAGCTCNGRTAFGLMPVTTAEDDPTLRPGDVVATPQGLAAVNGSGQFTPAASYAGFSPADRAHFSQMKVTPPDGVPRNALAVQKPAMEQPKAALNTR